MFVKKSNLTTIMKYKIGQQEEYTKEGIKWDKIDFIDNQPVLDLIAMKPLNIFALIDEEAIYPNGSDISLLQKVKQQHRSNELFQEGF